MISKLPVFENTEKITILNFNYNTLKELNQLQSFTNLLELNVSQNYLESTKGIGKLNKLQILNIKDNDLR